MGCGHARGNSAGLSASGSQLARVQPVFLPVEAGKTRDYPAGRDARHHISPEPPALGATNLDTDLRVPGLGIQRQTAQPAAAVSERISPPRFVVVMEPAAGGPSSHADAMRDASSFQFNAGVE
jgi:hypothetical protein